MCGIAGILRLDDQPTAEQDVAAMLDYIRHRGPDGQEIRVHHPCVFGHARLSIIDLEGGFQPMQADANVDHGRLIVVFNGEIYNHRELRKQLQAKGHQFKSDHSDTEVLAPAYRQWGTEFPKRLRGMFSFALWDEDKRQLLLARDRIGQKPLFIRHTENSLLFASQIPALCISEPPTINRSSLLSFLRLGYTGYDSLLNEITELPPAHVMTIHADTGEQKLIPFWKMPRVSKSYSRTDLLADTTDLIRKAVHYRLEADVPLGCFLSGGIDSSIVASLAHEELTKRGEGPLRTFSVQMPVMAYDESEAAQAVAKHIGTNHTQLVASANGDILADLRFLISVYGEPTADSSILPTYWLSKATRQHVRVALSGDGGDELFGGYDRYRAMRIIQRHRWWLKHLPADMISSANPKSKIARVKRLIDAAKQADAPTQYQSIMHLFSSSQLNQLGFEGIDPSRPYDAMPQWPDEVDPVHAAMRWDLMHYLPMEVLRKVDRASMAVGLEVRCPLLDSHVCELATHLPPEVLMPTGKPKELLRKIAGDLLPSFIAKRPKQGFALPIGQWFRGDLQEPVRELFRSGALASLGLSEAFSEQLLDEHLATSHDHTHRLFALLELAIWKQWLDHPTPPPSAGI